MYKRFWLGRTAPWGLRASKTSVCINAAGQDTIKKISFLGLLPGCHPASGRQKLLCFVPRALGALGAGTCLPRGQVGGVGSIPV